MPTIKRYPNRKLYDTEAKRYVTLDDITSMIRDGRDVQVIDYESGDDLTTLTLTQIILEQEKKSDDGFLPRSLLTSLIRTGGDTLEHVLRSMPSGLLLPGAGALLGLDEEDENGETGSEGEEAAEPGDDVIASTEDAEPVEEAQAKEKTSGGDKLVDVLHLLKMPSQQDLQDLRVQLAVLNQRLDELLASKDDETPDSTTADDQASSA
jgi:polyhydroxyalkanoate synthesis repressor PhaR